MDLALLNAAIVVISVATSSATLGYWLAARFKDLEAGIRGLDARVGGLEKEVGELKERVGGLENRVGGLEKEVGELKERVGGLENRVANLENRIGGLENKVGGLEKEVKNVRERLGGVETGLGELKEKVVRLREGVERLERVIYSYNELFLKVLEAKGALSNTEALLLLRFLETAIPHSTSKYYTKEVEERLRALLRKNPDDFTMQDVEELWNIADLMFKEYRETGRRDLLEYQAKLRLAAQVIKVLFVEPKILKGERVLKPGG